MPETKTSSCHSETEIFQAFHDIRPRLFKGTSQDWDIKIWWHHISYQLSVITKGQVCIKQPH